jgi:hypothetical protein
MDPQKEEEKCFFELMQIFRRAKFESKGGKENVCNIKTKQKQALYSALQISTGYQNIYTKK